MEGEEAEGCCGGGRGSGGGCLMVMTHGAESDVSSEFLKDRVGFACEADGTACKEGRSGKRGEYTLSCIEGEDVANEVEVECRGLDIPEDVRGCARPFAQDGLVALGGRAQGAVMLVAAFGSARVGVAAGMASFAGGDGEVDGKMAERGDSSRREVAKWL